jgi:cytosine/creatinine deaminase
MTYDLTISNVHLRDGRAVDLAIAGGTIVSFGAAGSLSGRRRIDGGGGLCLRPLSDSHLHLDKSGTICPGLPAPTCLHEAIHMMGEVKREAKARPQEVRDRMVTTLSLLQRTGTRLVRALVDVDETWGLTGFEAALAAREQVGTALKIRIVAFAQEGMTDRVAAMLTKAAARGADAIGGHTDIEADPTQHIVTAARIARDAGLPLEVHVDEPASADHFKLPIVLEHAAGLKSLTLVHCLSLGRLAVAEQERWIERIRRANATVVVAPSVLLFGLPLAPIPRLLAAGVPVGLGSDNLQDVFVPFGTGRLLEAVRVAILAAQVNRAEWMAAMLHGATGTGYSLIENAPAEIAEGSPAAFSVFSGSNPSAVLFGDDAIRMTVIDGRVEEEKVQ